MKDVSSIPQKERYGMLDSLTKDVLINIIKENQCFISDKRLGKVDNINIPFEEFWKAYDYKNGSKKDAEKKWNKLTDEDRKDAMLAVWIYKKKRDPNYVCMATTWINQRRWEWILEQEKEKQETKPVEVKKKKVIMDDFLFQF